MAIKIVQKPKQHTITFAGGVTAYQMLNNAGLDYRQETIKRTKQGKDVNGQAFTEYSERYANNKASGKVARTRGKDTSKVDLETSGDLLNSIKVETNQSRVKVYPTRHAEIGYYHNEGIGQPKREWWGITDLIRRQLLATMNRAVKIK